MKKPVYLCAIVCMVLTLTACSEELDSYSSPMHWRGFADNESPTVTMPAEGGDTTLLCTNYVQFAIVRAEEIAGGSDTVVYEKADSTWDYGHIATRWADVQVGNGVLQVKLRPNDSGNGRTFIVRVRTAMIVDDCKFVQKTK